MLPAIDDRRSTIDNDDVDHHHHHHHHNNRNQNQQQQHHHQNTTTTASATTTPDEDDDEKLVDVGPESALEPSRKLHKRSADAFGQEELTLRLSTYFSQGAKAGHNS